MCPVLALRKHFLSTYHVLSMVLLVGLTEMWDSGVALLLQEGRWQDWVTALAEDSEDTEQCSGETGLSGFEGSVGAESPGQGHPDQCPCLVWTR